MKTKPLCTTVLVLSSIWFGTGAHVLLHGQLSAARESHIPVGGAELYVREVGKGPAIIVLHGGPDFDQSYLLPEMDRLSDSCRLIYYDQRGRGKSAINVRPEDVTLASDIADLEKVRQYFHLESLTLLGHSWGSVLGILAVKARPDLFDAWVGTGQIMNMQRGEVGAYRRVLAKARARGDTDAIGALEKSGAPPYSSARLQFRRCAVEDCKRRCFRSVCATRSIMDAIWP